MSELICGLDEVGMGPLAGPICAAVVVFPTDAKPIPGIDDSKKLTPTKRVKLAPIIMKEAIFVSIGWAQPSVIDEKGIAEAWRRACLDALEGSPPFSLLKIDGIRRLEGFAGKQACYVQGDSRFWHIGAASIVAKVARDREMLWMDRYWPDYYWKDNMGYGSKAHIDALLRLGPSAYHRNSFLKKIYLKNEGRIVKERWKKWESRFGFGRLLDSSTEEDLTY